MSLRQSPAVSVPINIRAAAELELRRRRRENPPKQWVDIARPKQVRPHVDHPIPEMRRDDWLIWYVQAGRGWGKTLAGSRETERQSHLCPRLAIVAATLDDGVSYCIEGESGLRSIDANIKYNQKSREILFPSGCRGKLFTAEEPERLRGPNNYYAWCDEFASWRYQKASWDMLMFTLRKGTSQCVITTTPKPSALSTEIKTRAVSVVTRGTTYENIANLSRSYIENIITPYEGTTLGRQELDAEDIEDVDGALWTRDTIEVSRVDHAPAELKRVVVAVDPAVTANSDSDETGLIIGALGYDNHGYILSDKSLRGSPHLWATAAVNAYHEHKADRLVAEVNNGGDMVITTINAVASGQGRSVATKKISASRGKHTRAEPIASLYEQGRVHHVGAFTKLEDQMCTSLLDGNSNDDRVDALVWALSELMLGSRGSGTIRTLE